MEAYGNAPVARQPFFVVGLHRRDFATIGLAPLVISPSGKIGFARNNVQLDSNRKV